MRAQFVLVPFATLAIVSPACATVYLSVEKAQQLMFPGATFTPEFREQLIAAAAHEHRSQASFLEGLVRNFCADTGLLSGASSPTRKRPTAGRRK